MAVRAGDVVSVPAGVPHAIGAGILICELHEPTDFGFLYEWRGYSPDAGAASMGLGWQRALEALDLSDSQPEAFLGLTPEMAGFFGVDWVGAEAKTAGPSFAILLVTAGSGRLSTEAGAVELRRGEAWLLPHSAGESRFSGEGLTVLRCLPPQVED